MATTSYSFEPGQSKGMQQRQPGWLWRCLVYTTIDPRSSRMIAYWDLVSTCALVFTAVITPVEVAFLTPPPMAERWEDALFLSNRVVDCIFILDMLLQFRTAYQIDTVHGMQWVKHPTKIAIHYLRSYWFWLDLVSILTSVFDLVGGDGTDFKGLRAVRTLRLIKLVKLLRTSRIFKRWEMRSSINYAHLTLCGVIIMVCLTCHWCACVWGLQATFDPLNSWMGAKEHCIEWGHPNQTVAIAMLTDGSCAPKWHCHIGECNSKGECTGGTSCSSWDMLYVYSLYFSVMTITSVGYGDVTAQPFNQMEQIVATVIMLLTGMVWGYLVGVFCSMATVSPQTRAFREDMTQLNSFMMEHQLPPAMRFRLREYMHQAIYLERADQSQELLGKLSPAMQGELSLIVNETTLGCVWYLCLPGIEVGLLLELACRMQTQFFPPREICPIGFLYIVKRGRVLYHGRPLGYGDRAGLLAVWGEDILMDKPSLELSHPAMAMTYTICVCFDRSTLVNTIASFPHSQFLLSVVRRRLVMRRCILVEAERRTFGAKPRVHFRGRLYPIYAMDLAKKMRDERMAELAEKAEREVKSSIARGITLNYGTDGSRRHAPLRRAKTLKASLTQSLKKRKSETGGDRRERQRLERERQERERQEDKFRHAALLDAAALFAVKKRTNAMLRDASMFGAPSPRRKEKAAGDASNTSTIPPSFSRAPLSPSSPEEEANMSAHIERRVQSALRAVIPEISAAIAAEMKLARRRKRHSEVSPDRELEPGEASVYAPERMRSRQRSRPPRTRSSTREGDFAPEPHAPQPSNAPSVQQGRCVAVHVLTGDASPDTIATQHRSRPSPNTAPIITSQSEHLDA
jgi:potassium voltage-gated channel Eag-related subfamily H protein 7